MRWGYNINDMKYIAVLVCMCCLLWGCAGSESGSHESGVTSVFSLDNLTAWCIVPFDSKQRGPEERALMLKGLGITKMAYDWRVEHISTFDEELDMLKKYGIKLQGFWLNIDQHPEKDPYLPIILDLLRRHGIQTQLWCLLADDEKWKGMSQQERVAYSARPIAYVASEAEKIGCTVGLYNHGGWFGEPENQLAIIEHLDMSNIGMVYNFHHAELQADRFSSFFPEIMPHLLALNISGLKGLKPSRVVPVGQGDVEAGLLQIVKDSGYRGPIGIINETTDPDAEEGLRINIEGLKTILKDIGDAEALRSY